MSQLLITVFTPTYNREHLLTRLFNSLREQTFKDFEWLIVDDGSTDNTHDVAQKFVEEGIVPIKSNAMVGNIGPSTKALSMQRENYFLLLIAMICCRQIP